MPGHSAMSQIAGGWMRLRISLLRSNAKDSHVEQREAQTELTTPTGSESFRDFPISLEIQDNEHGTKELKFSSPMLTLDKITGDETDMGVRPTVNLGSYEMFKKCFKELIKAESDPSSLFQFEQNS